MKNYYEKEWTIPSAYTDRRCALSVYHAALLLQDAMTEMFHQYQCDAIQMSQSHHAIWAAARSKIKFDREIFWLDQVKMKVYPVKVTPVSVHLNVLLETPEGEPVLRCRQELCAMDVRDHSLRRVDTTPFPMEMELLPPVITEPCLRMRMKLGEESLVYQHKIRTMDTDMNHHMNNTAYVRLLADAIPSAFWDTHRVCEFDIQYVNEGMEGAVLKVYCREENGAYAMQIKEGDRVLVKSVFRAEVRAEA